MNNFLTGTSNAAYHANKTHLSSSQLKLLLKSREQFYRECVLGQKPPEAERSVFVEGTLTHSLILEPHLVDAGYEVFPGMRKQGKVWDDFLATANPAKQIVSMAQMLRCEALAKSHNQTPIAVELVSGGYAEHSMIAELLSVPVKARADYINVDRGYIVDVKTSAMPTGADFFRETVKQYSYDLSAALYAQIAQHTYAKDFTFYWLVLSKADKGCAVYKASLATMADGYADVLAALRTYRECSASGNWRNPESVTFVSTNEVEEI